MNLSRLSPAQLDLLAQAQGLHEALARMPDSLIARGMPAVQASSIMAHANTRLDGYARRIGVTPDALDAILSARP